MAKSTADEGYAFFEGLDVAPDGRVDIGYQALSAVDAHNRQKNIPISLRSDHPSAAADGQGGPSTLALVQQSYDQALAPLNALRRYIIGMGAVSMLAALVIGISLARASPHPFRAPPVMAKILTDLGLSARGPPRSPAQAFDLFEIA